MSRLQPARQGDIGDTRTVTLSGIEDLVGATAVAHVRRGSTNVALTAAITDTDARTVVVQLGTAGGWLPSEPVAGDWDLEVQVTFGDGSVLTWPGHGYDTISVYADIDPT